jgi:prophage tail gpP-like protein
MSEAHGVAARGPPPGSTDILSLTVGNQVLTGWQRVSVTRPLAGIPASFSIEVTEKYPNATDLDLKSQTFVLTAGSGASRTFEATAKTDAELEMAVRARIGTVVVDNSDDRSRLHDRAIDR